jgi:glycosyltransferase involved in cell wall biosynthesis
MPLCLLPNSTPILRHIRKVNFSSPVKILYVGTFAPKDGVYYLIKAFEKLITSHPHVRLHLIGKGNEKDMKDVLSLIQDNDKIDYLGRVSDEDLETLLLNADILTMTRVNSVFANYGFPFKLSEYLSTGNPVLATDVSDIKLYLKDKVNACIAEPENIDSIYDSLIFLIDNENLALEIGEKGIAVVHDHFDIKKNGETFVKFLNNL